jgi:hypothetical protein
MASTALALGNQIMPDSENAGALVPAPGSRLTSDEARRSSRPDHHERLADATARSAHADDSAGALHIIIERLFAEFFTSIWDSVLVVFISPATHWQTDSIAYR